MATKKIQIIPPGYTDVCYPQTIASAVIEETNKRFMTDAERTKLTGVATGANNYTHPSTHPPSIIAQDASNRFVTDTEKATWNAKETTAGSQAKVDAHIAVKTNPHAVTKAQVGLGSVSDYGIATQAEAEAGTLDTKYMTPLSTKQAITKAAPVNATTSVSGLMSNTDKSKLDGVATGANNYIHPATDGNLHVPATGTTNSGKVLKAGSTAGSLSWGTLTAADVGAATTSHTHSYVPTTTTVNGKALSANIAITAADVSAYSKAEIDGKIVDNLTAGGATNVLSAEQGKVLGASVSQLQSSISSIDVSWNAITGKPTTFTPSTHIHDYAPNGYGLGGPCITITDVHTINKNGWYMGANVSNAPDGSWWTYKATVHNDAWVEIEATPFTNGSPHTSKRVKYKQNGVWGGWLDPFQSVVNEKQAVVNAINGSLGYASGLTTSNTHDDYAWWIQNKVASTFPANTMLYNYGVFSNGFTSQMYTSCPVSINADNIYIQLSSSTLTFQSPITSANGVVVTMAISHSLTNSLAYIGPGYSSDNTGTNKVQVLKIGQVDNSYSMNGQIRYFSYYIPSGTRYIYFTGGNAGRFNIYSIGIKYI